MTRDCKVTIPRRLKYGNRRVIIDGVRFDSVAEGFRYQQLKLLEQGGEISDLKLQPEFSFKIGGILICKYRGDFSYIDSKHPDRLTVEDKKGHRTRDYRIKRKLMQALYPAVRHIET